MPCFIIKCNSILYFIYIYIYILIVGLSVTVSCFLIIYLKQSWLSDTEYDLSTNSNLSFHLGGDFFLIYFFE